MQLVTLPATELTVSRFIFGTGSLFNAGRDEARQRLLHSAVDAGFTHFDTAPYYGFGLAESDLRPVLRANPHLTFTTKVGLYSPGEQTQRPSIIFLRKAAGRLVKSFSRPEIDFTLSRARFSLETSLKRTGRDTVDFYALHEPELELVQTDEWRRWLEDCVTRGLVRYFGEALTADRLRPFLISKNQVGSIVQMQDSLEYQEADLLKEYGRPMQITYGYVSAASQHRTVLPASEILRRALSRNHQGAIIVSTKNPRRVHQYAELLK